jgi:hypothetical protein
MNREHLVAGILMTVCLCSHAQEYFRSYVSEVAANVDLPAHIKVADGEVSLWADFENGTVQGIPLFLVNRTSKPMSFSSQDGDLYIKLEAKNESGEWVRAQPHRYSDCGNSYGRRTLQPGMHFRLHGYRPDSGREAEIRFASHSAQTVVSNTGKGWVKEEDIEAAILDGMSLKAVPRTIRTAFDPEWRRPEMKVSGRLGSLVLLKAYGPVPALKREAEKLLEDWRLEPPDDAEEKLAVMAFEWLLWAEWEKDVSPDRLFRFCMDHIEGRNRADHVKTAVVWETLNELASVSLGHRSGNALDKKRLAVSEDWGPVTQLAAKHLLLAAREEAIGISGLLSHDELVDSFISQAALEPLLNGDPYMAAKIAAEALARRGATERLAELAMETTGLHQLVVLAALASGGVSYEETGIDGWGGIRQPRPNTKEEAFWQHVMRTQTLAACGTLRHQAPIHVDLDAFGPIVRDSIRTYWRMESERSNQMQEDFALEATACYHTQLSVELLASSKREDDIPLLQSLLTYRGYQLEKGYRGNGNILTPKTYQKKQFSVRQSALAGLNSMGVEVSANVVLEEELSETGEVIEKGNE